MAKKSKRAKAIRPMKQLQHSSSVSPLLREQLTSRIEDARQQLLKKDLVGCVSTCEALLDSLPKGSMVRLDVLGLQGLAHGMLHHYQQSYALFTEAITIDPQLADLWYNRGLACRCLGRIGQAVLDLEHAIALSKNDSSEVTRNIVRELQHDRQELQNAMQKHGANITFEQYLEREEAFQQTVELMRQEKWQEVEPLLRQLAEEANRMPQYWGNLGICLIMQSRYDEAEAALKQALAIDPKYPIARTNLKQLPKIRRSKESPAIEVVEPSLGKHVKQTLNFFRKA